MKWAFLGPRGTFTEEAALHLIGSKAVEVEPYRSIPDVLEAVALRKADKGVVPLENSIEGSVHSTLDSLLSQTELFVQEELVLAVVQNLIANPDSALSDIQEVWSHPQALAQCTMYLRDLGVQQMTFDSTARAVAAVQDSGRKDVAAIGAAVAADLFNLKILQREIQDAHQNHTRFVVVGFPGTGPIVADKTMLVITPCKEHAGVLASLLQVFAALHVNLSWIESRPTRTRLGTYQFFLDVEAGMQTNEMQTAVQVIQTYGHSIRVLGSYTTHVQPRV